MSFKKVESIAEQNKLLEDFVKSRDRLKDEVLKTAISKNETMRNLQEEESIKNKKVLQELKGIKEAAATQLKQLTTGKNILNIPEPYPGLKIDQSALRLINELHDLNTDKLGAIIDNDKIVVGENGIIDVSLLLNHNILKVSYPEGNPIIIERPSHFLLASLFAGIEPRDQITEQEYFRIMSRAGYPVIEDDRRYKILTGLQEEENQKAAELEAERIAMENERAMQEKTRKETEDKRMEQDAKEAELKKAAELKKSQEKEEREQAAKLLQSTVTRRSYNNALKKREEIRQQIIAKQKELETDMLSYEDPSVYRATITYLKSVIRKKSTASETKEKAQKAIEDINELQNIPISNKDFKPRIAAVLRSVGTKTALDYINVVNTSIDETLQNIIENHPLNQEIKELEGKEQELTAILGAGIKKGNYNLYNIDLKNGRLGDISFDMNAIKKGRIVAHKGAKKIMDKQVDLDTIELLMKRFNSNRKYSPLAYKTVKRLITMSGIDIHPSSKKYNHVVGGMQVRLPVEKIPQATPVIYKHYEKPDELLDRFELLNAQKGAGNKSMMVKNEMLGILDELYKSGHIDKNAYVKLTKKYIK